MQADSTLRFDFFAPARTFFGWGRLSEIGELARPLGRRAFLVSGSSTLDRNGTLARIEATLRDAGMEVERLVTISREPEISDVDAAVARVLQLSPESNDFVIGIGGGSAVDLAKAVAALATNASRSSSGAIVESADAGAFHSVADYLEGVGKGLRIEAPPLPVLAVPTTAGTGSEATKNAVISSSNPPTPFKKSLRSDLMVPRVVLIDPELTLSLSPSVTASTGMDAITQLIESYLSRRAQPIPQALALGGLQMALPSIVTAVKQGQDRGARERMAYAAYLSGMALANSGLGLAHGVAAALGSVCRIPHGLACAIMLAPALRMNRTVRQSEIARLATLIDGDQTRSEEQAADRFIAHIEGIAVRIGIPSRLSDLGVSREQVPTLVQCSRGNSMDGNPRTVSDDELEKLLDEML